MSHSYALVGLVLVPLIGSLFTFAVPRNSGETAKWIALVTSLITLAYVAVLGLKFDTGANAARFQDPGSWVWIKALGVHIALGMDGIALVLVAMATFLVPVVILASWDALDTKSGPEEGTVSKRSVPAY